jgi:hypothetical protein
MVGFDSVHRDASDAGTRSAPPIVHEVLRSAGESLDEEIHETMRARFGKDFSEVRVHTDAAAAGSAKALQANAYTVGRHIAFAAGRYTPGTVEGQSLLAHELTHVIQQGNGAMPVGRLSVSTPSDAAERQADRASAGEGPPVTSTAPVMVHRSPNDGSHDDSPSAPTDVSVLDKRLYAGINAGGSLGYQDAAEALNAFNDPDMKLRLRKLTLTQLRSLQLGALQNPRLGISSAVAKNTEQATKIATQATIEQAVTQGEQDGSLTLPKTSGGSKPPGSLTAITIGGGNTSVGVDPADRVEFLAGEDHSGDATYIDNAIVHASYDILTNHFQLDYADGGTLGLDYDQVLKGAKSGPPAIRGPYFTNKRNGRVYPTSFDKQSIPRIAECALEIERKEPGARARTLGTLIDLVVSAHGVASSTIKLSRSQAGNAANGKAPKKAEDGVAPGKSGASDGKPLRRASVIVAAADEPRSNTGSGGGPSSSVGRSAGRAAPRSGGARSGGGTQDGLREVTPDRTAAPIGELNAAPSWDVLPGFGKAFVSQIAYGETKVAGAVVGPGTLLKAAPTAQVVGVTTEVAHGTVSVGSSQLTNVVVATGGQLLAAGAQTGRQVLAFLVLKDLTYLIVSPAAGTDYPAQAPGRDTNPRTAPGTDNTPVTAPGADPSSPAVRDPVDSTPVDAPGPLVDKPAECQKLIGSKITHDHHVFPQKFRQRFEQLQIDIDKWTITMRWDEHVGKDGVHAAMGWNELWDEFFDDMPEIGKMTTARALGWQQRAKNFAFRLMVEAGIDRRRLHNYREKK